VVTSTTQLSILVEEIGGNHVTVTNIIPPKENPLNYNITEGDIQTLSSADVLFVFDWQRDQFLQPLTASSISHQPQIAKITMVNSWLLPAGQIELTDRVTEALSQVDKQNAGSYLTAANNYKAMVDDKAYTAISNLIRQISVSPMTSPNVICAEAEKDFIKWMGLTVVATYEGSQPLTPDELNILVEKGKAEKVATIVDDLQSGQYTGIELTRGIGARRFILSSYPGGYDYAWSWSNVIDTNISLVLWIGPPC
jgi:ABC-type Zn uptake system ZnuABC Zn-binding protein ZnuA